MSDDADIDEILKSIDALLKEGEPEQAEKKNDALIDDEPDIGESVPGVEAKPVGKVIEDAHSDVSIDEVIESSTGMVMEETGSHKGLVAEADDEIADTIDEPKLVVEPDRVGQHGVRIVLNEEMQVEDTPELPLSFSEKDAEAEQIPEVQADDLVQDEVVSSETDLDVEGLIGRISNEINAQLQERLPDMLKEMVTVAVHRHLGMDFADDDGNPDGQ